MISYYEPDIVTAQDYYPFGMMSRVALPNSDVPYRFGFNGKMNDNDVKGGLGLQQDYGMRIYDNRVGRFLSVDPLTKDYPELTPYQFASNRPIDGVDQDGEEYLKTIPKFEYSSNRTWQDYVSAIDNAGIDFVNLVPTTWNSLVVTAQGLYEHKYLQNLKNDAKQLASGLKQVASKFVKAPLSTIASPQGVEFFTNAFIGAKIFSPVKSTGGLMKPIKAPKAPTLPKYVYRFDTRTPEEVKAAGGFKAWGENMSLGDHISGESIRNKTSGYVATSTGTTTPEIFSEGYDFGYIYKLKTPSNGIIVNESAVSKSYGGYEYGFDWEQEIVVPYKISAKKIVSWKKTGE